MRKLLTLTYLMSHCSLCLSMDACTGCWIERK